MPRPFKSHGKSTNIGFCAYISALFKTNELLYKYPSTKKPLTDHQIALDLLEEFPGRKMALAFLDPDNRNTVNDYRNKYNSGTFSPGKLPPEQHSFRYNEEGKRVDGRTGKRELPVITERGLISANKYWSSRATHKEN